jgi:hypothetical protein
LIVSSAIRTPDSPLLLSEASDALSCDVTGPEGEGAGQSGTPDIPRPGWVRPVEFDRLPTDGVVLDTSGSMDRELLGKALGAIAFYSLARDVPAARVVFCDAAAYDAGYVPVEEIAGRVQVRGRAGRSGLGGSWC